MEIVKNEKISKLALDAFLATSIILFIRLVLFSLDYICAKKTYLNINIVYPWWERYLVLIKGESFEIKVLVATILYLFYYITIPCIIGGIWVARRCRRYYLRLNILITLLSTIFIILFLKKTIIISNTESNWFPILAFPSLVLGSIIYIWFSTKIKKQ